MVLIQYWKIPSLPILKTSIGFLRQIKLHLNTVRGESPRNPLNKLGNKELNKALYSLALTQIRKNSNPIIYEYYQSKIKEGRKKKQAVVYVK